MAARGVMAVCPGCGRRLAEAESEQQRLADEEEYEKAAELSVEIESLREESESAARRLR